MTALLSNPAGRMQTLDLLRGVAALLVCWCHFSPTLPTVIAQQVASIGTAGVPIFFVISGFIIPWGLLKAEYGVASYPRFIAKRMLRLHPPYLLSLIFTIAFSFLAAAWLKKPMHDSIGDILLESIYLKFPPENPVYWTLGIELQYYITLGLMFSLVFHRAAWVRHLALVAMLAVGYVIKEVWPFASYLPFFAIGFLVVWHMKKLANSLVVIAYVLPVAALAAIDHGMTWLIAGLSAASLIAVIPDLKVPRFFLFLGMISYSLYLIHFPLGIKAMNLLMPRIPEAFHGGLFIFLTVLVIGAGWLFYRLIELPAIGWSSKVRLSDVPRKTVDGSTA